MCLQVLPGDLLEMTFLWSHTELPIQKLRAGEAKQGVLWCSLGDSYIGPNLRTDEKIQSLQFIVEETEVHKGNLVVFPESFL